jgi:methyltransferase (TIGR00027 family)
LFPSNPLQEAIFNLLIKIPKFKELFGILMTRTIFFDEFINEFKDGKYQQLVILGAGYDTRPKRFEEELRNVSVFELDQEYVQEKKKVIVDKFWPKNVNFVRTNFLKDDMKNKLLEKGYDPKKNTVFLMEGVVPYLNEASLKENLEFMKSYSNETIFYFDMISKIKSDNRIEFILEFVLKLFGEKVTYKIPNIEEILNSSGFKIEKIISDSQFGEICNKVFIEDHKYFMEGYKLIKSKIK